VAALLAGAALGASAQDFSGIIVEKFASGFTYADGPVWTRDGDLVISDVPANHLFRIKPGVKPEIVREDSGGAMGNAVDSQGRLYTCESRNRRLVRMNRKGELEVLADKWEGKRLNAPNDVAVRKDGNVYFTDPAFGSQEDTRELGFYGVYRWDSGTLSVISRATGRPNGIAVSPDGRKLYVTNADERNVRVYDLNRKGEASNERVLIQGIAGVPNGIRTDEQGNLYLVAQTLQVYNPAGQKLWEIPLEGAPSNLAFGEDLLSLFVTDHRTVYRLRMPVKGWVNYQ
jgi:gluconolactonase